MDFECLKKIFYFALKEPTIILLSQVIGYIAVVNVYSFD